MIKRLPKKEDLKHLYSRDQGIDSLLIVIVLVIEEAVHERLEPSTRHCAVDHPEEDNEEDIDTYFA